MSDQNNKKSAIVEESVVPAEQPAVEGEGALQLKVRRVRVSTSAKGGSVRGPGEGVGW